jgi:hypothetical protein
MRVGKTMHATVSEREIDSETKLARIGSDDAAGAFR